MTLKDHEHVTTESRGEGLRRKVVIVPKVKAPAAAPAEAVTEPGNVAPPVVEHHEESQPVVENQPVSPAAVIKYNDSEDQPDFGNQIPKEREIDDNVGNQA
jgi:hypothetical protein